MADKKKTQFDRFQALLDAYGANFARWPAGDRDWAQRLSEESAAAQALRDEAAALDALLDLAPAPSPSLELMANVLVAADLPARRRWAAALWPFGPIWKPLSTLAAAGALGIMLGVAMPSLFDLNGTPDTDQIGELAAGTVPTLESDL